MAEETVNQEVTTTETAPDRTFTQAEVDAIISDRLKREREKYADYADLKTRAGQYDEISKAHGETMAQNEALQKQLADLQKSIATRDVRDKVSAETGVPVSFLTAETEEECKKQAEAALAWRGQQPKYPTVADGGEVPQVSGGSTRQQFAAWFDSNIKK